MSSVAYGRLAVLVEANISKFVSGLTAAEQRAQSFGERVGNRISAASTLAAAAITKATVVTATMTTLAIRNASALDSQAKALGMSATQLSAWNGAARIATGGAVDLSSGLATLTRNAVAAAGGSKEAAATFRALGVSVVDSNGKLRNTRDILGDVADKFSTYQDGLGKAALAQRLFGETGGRMIPILNNGAKGLADLEQQARSLGAVLDSETVSAASQVTSEFAKVQLAVQGVGNDLMKELLPAILETSQQFTAWLQQIREDGTLDVWRDRLVGIAGYAKELAYVVGGLLVTKALRPLAIAVYDVATAFAYLGRFILANPWLALAAAVGMFVTTIAMLPGNIDHTRQAQLNLVEATALLAQAQGTGLVVALEEAEALREVARAALEQVRAKQILAHMQPGTNARDRFAGLAQEAAQLEMTLSVADLSLDQARKRVAEFNAELDRIRNSAGGAVTPIVDLTNNTNKLAASQKRALEQARNFAGNVLQDLLNKFDPLAALTNKYNEELAKLQPLLRGTTQDVAQYAQVKRRMTAELRQAQAITKLQLQLQKQEEDLVGNLVREYAKERREMELRGQALAEHTALVEAAHTAQQLFLEGRRDSPRLSALEEAGIRASAAAHYAYVEAAERANAARDAWLDTMSTGISDLQQLWATWLVEDAGRFASFADGIVDIAKNMVKRMLAEYAKLAMIKLVTGEGGSWAQVASQAFSGGGGTAGNWLGNLFGASGATGGAAGVLASGYATGAAATPWTAGLGAYGAAAGGINAGAATSYGVLATTTGQVGGAALGASSGMWASIMAAMPWAALIVVGMMYADKFYGQGWDPNSSANREAMSPFGGGFKPLPAILTSIDNRILQAIGFNERWANLLTGASIGTRLFGYKNPQVQQSGYHLNFGAGGLGGEMFADIRQRGGVFRSSRYWTETSDLVDELVDTFAQVEKEITRGLTDLARRFRVDVPAIAEASFRATYDDEGEFVSGILEIFGRTYEGAWEEIAGYVYGYNQLGVLGNALTMAQIGATAPAGGTTSHPTGGPGGPGGPRDEGPGTLAKVTGETEASYEQRVAALVSIAQRWDTTAERFMEGVSVLVAAALDMVNGTALLGEEGTLVAVADLVDEYNRSNESLLDTYGKLVASAMWYEQALSFANQTVDMTREGLVRFAADITEAAGGVQQASALWSNLFTQFYTGLEQTQYQLDQLTTSTQSFADRIGYTGDIMDRTSFREAFEAALPTLSPDQIVEWLQLGQAIVTTTEAAAALADQQERAAAAGRRLNELLGSLARGGFAEPIQALITLDQRYREQIATVHQLARENGRAAASELELVFVRRMHQRELRRLAATYTQTILEIGARLGMSGFTQLGGAEQSGIDAVNQAVEDRYARELRLLQRLDEYVRGMTTGVNTPLTARQQLAEAEAEFNRLYSLAQGGDLDALERLQGAADTYLGLANRVHGGVGPYAGSEGIFETVRGMLAGLVDRGPQNEPLPTSVVGGPVVVTPGEEFYSMNAAERVLLAQQMVDYLAAVSLAMRVPVLEVAGILGLSLSELVTNLGGNLSTLTGATVQILADLAFDLGIPLSALVESVGLELPQIASGLRELATDLGFDINQLIEGVSGGLYGLAVELGTDLETLATALGQDLGALTDVNSPIYQGLQSLLTQLPQEQAAALQTYLEAITTATTEADARAAIAETEAAINAMPVGIRNALAPFFQNVLPAGALADLDYLESIDGGIATLAGLVERVRRNLEAQNRAQNLEGYYFGTDYVPATGAYLLHEGESVLPRWEADAWRRGEDTLPYEAAAAPKTNTSSQQVLERELALARERARDEKLDRMAQALETLVSRGRLGGMGNVVGL